MRVKCKYYKILIPVVIVILVGIGTAVYFTRMEKEESHIPDKELIKEADLGLKAIDSGELLDAMKYYQDFINKAGHNPEVYGKWLILAYQNVAYVYASFNDMQNSLQFSLKGYDLIQQTKNYNQEVIILTNIAGVYQFLGNFDKATEYNNKLLHVKDNRDLALGCYYVTSGEIKAKTNSGDPIGDWKKAYWFMDKAHKDEEKVKILNSMASYYGQKGHEELELKYLKKAFEASSYNNDPLPRTTLTRTVLDYYLKKNDAANAMPYTKLYLALSDSSMSARKFLDAKNVQEQYERQKADENIKRLNITINKRQLVNYIAVSAFVVALIILTIVIYQNRKLNAAYLALYRKNIEMIEKGSHVKQKNDTVILRENELYNQILRLMENPEVYCASDFGLPKLASLVGSNVNYVSKVVNEHSGQNVRAFINTYRIGEACRRISDADTYSRLTLMAIAESVGYSNHVNFNRAFKQITGMTPSVFQKMSRESSEKG